MWSKVVTCAKICTNAVKTPPKLWGIVNVFLNSRWTATLFCSAYLFDATSPARLYQNSGDKWVWGGQNVCNSSEPFSFFSVALGGIILCIKETQKRLTHHAEGWAVHVIRHQRRILSCLSSTEDFLWVQSPIKAHDYHYSTQPVIVLMSLF